MEIHSGNINAIWYIYFRKDEKQTNEYCNCVLGNTMKIIPNPEIYNGCPLPESLVIDIGLKCYKTVKENQS